MDPSTDAVTRALTGMLPFIVLAAALLSLPVCFGLLHLYRRAVLAGMNRLAGVAVAPAVPAVRGAPPMALRVLRLHARTPAEPAGVDAAALRRARRGPWRAAALYAFAGGVYALVMAVGWLLATRDPHPGAVKFAVLAWSYAWPALLAVLMVAAYDRRRRAIVLGTYAGVFALLAAAALARSPALGVLQLPLYWLITNAAPTLLLASFLWRPIRAVGPLVLVFLLMVAIGSQLLLSIAAADERLLRGIAEFGFALGLGGHGVFFAMIVLGMLAFAALGWPLLRWLGRRYEAKRFSDQAISVDALFLLFGVVQSIGLAFEGPWWILTGLVAFAGFKTVALLGMRLMHAGEVAGRTLLLLRVFRLGRRSERLFDRLRRHWQPLGTIRMIAGPDLVTSTVEPHEFLEFVSGRLARQFVPDRADLERRLAGLDRRPDPDGRFRIHEFFCRADTWQMTMERLAGDSDAVLMDLRSFAPANQGCRYEIGRLLDGVDLARVVLLVDDSTDRAFLDATLAQAWSEIGVHSPNRRTPAPALRVFHLHDASEAALLALTSHLLSRASM